MVDAVQDRVRGLGLIDTCHTQNEYRILNMHKAWIPLDIVGLKSPFHFIHFEAKWHLYASVIDLSLYQIMACHLIGAKPLSESMLI